MRNIGKDDRSTIRDFLTTLDEVSAEWTRLRAAAPGGVVPPMSTLLVEMLDDLSDAYTCSDIAR
jgi:hypothetical protein